MQAECGNGGDVMPIEHNTLTAGGAGGGGAEELWQEEGERGMLSMATTERVRQRLLELGRKHPSAPTGRAFGCLVGYHNWKRLAGERDEWGDLWELCKCRDCGKLLIDKW